MQKGCHMGIYLAIFLFLFTVGPIIIFHRKHQFESDTAWAIILPFLATAFYAALLIKHEYETSFGFWFLVIALILGIYSTIVSIIMYAQYHNRIIQEKEQEQSRAEYKEQIKHYIDTHKRPDGLVDELPFDIPSPIIKCMKCGYQFPPGSEKNFCPKCGHPLS